MKRNKAVIAFITILAITILTTFSLRHSGVRPGSHLLPESAPQPTVSESSHPPVAAPAATPTEAEKSSGHADPPQPIQASPELREAIAREAAETGQPREAYDQPGEAAEFYRLKRVPEGEKYVPVERYLAAREQMRRMPRYSTTQNRLLPAESDAAAESASEANLLGAWTPLGPGNIGGRTRALLIDPTDPNVMYAAGVTGGVWKTTNGGAMWTPLADLIANIAVSALVMDPKNPNVIYAGTGEGVTGDFRGAGIFKTTNGGATWTQLGSTGSSDFYFVNDLVISPVSSQRIYAATLTGVWRSLDGGATWHQALNPQVAGGCLDLAMRTDQATDYIFAACGTFQQATIYRNPDAAGAGAWTAVHTEAGMGRTSLALAPSNQNVIYVATAEYLNGTYRHGLHAIFRSTSSGDAGTWTAQVRNTDAVRLNTLLFTNTLFASLSACGLAADSFSSQGWYDNVIAVDPTDENRVWAGGIDLFRSDDGGRNWGLASHWWAEKDVPQYAHADQHVIAFHPQYNGFGNQTMFVAGDGGVFRTGNARAAVATGPFAACNPAGSAVTWTSLNNNYGVTQFYHGAVSPDGQSWIGGTQDNGTLRGTTTDGVNGWREIYGGDGGYVAIDPHNPNVIYAETTGLSMRKSTDGGATFSRARFGISEPGSNFLFITPFAMDPSDPQRLWIGGRSVWRTSDGAASWEQASMELQQGGLTSAIAVAPTHSGSVLAGSSTGDLYTMPAALLSNADTRWNSTRPRAGFVSSVAWDPVDLQIAYATYSTFGGSHVWRSLNGGYVWTPLDGSGTSKLPDLPINCLVVDPTNRARLFVGTDLGVFVSTDAGATWAVENTGFANVVVEWLTINTAGGVTTLYAFTHGRGVWQVNLGNNGCSPALSATRQAFPAEGGEGSVSVSDVPGCDWTASSNADWITITEGTTGRGNGLVKFRVAPNNSLFPRPVTGNLVIAGRSFTVTQSAPLDRAAPSVSFKTPVTGSTFTTYLGSVELTGTASDDIAVNGQLLLASDRGFSTRTVEGGYYQGLRNWTLYSRFPLQVGTNRITATAWDYYGNTGSMAITVNYQPEFLLSVIAGQGTSQQDEGGPAINGYLRSATSLAIDPSGNIYVADTGNHRIRKITTDGRILTVAGNGQPGFSGDNGPATSAQLDTPIDLALDATGNLYIADLFNFRIRKVTSDGIISTIVGSGPVGQGNGSYGGDDGPATAARLTAPGSVAIDATGNVFVSDSGRIRKIAAASGIIITVAGNGRTGFSGDGGPASAAQFTSTPGDLAFDQQGNLYVLDSPRVRRIDTAGMIQTVAGNGSHAFNGDNIPAISTGLDRCNSIAPDNAGNLYLTAGDIRGMRLLRINPAGIMSTIAGLGSSNGPVNGTGVPATSIVLSDPFGIAPASSGRIYLADSNLVHLITHFEPDQTPPTISLTAPSGGAVLTAAVTPISLAGTASANSGISAITWRNSLTGASGVATGTDTWSINQIGLLSGLNRITVTAWNMSGQAKSIELSITYELPTTIRNFAGTSLNGFNGDGLSSANSQLWKPETVALDAAGNLYIADTGNHRIRRVSRDGVITTVAGNGQLGSSGDGGPATAASLNEPNGVALDGAGNLYISDTNNHRIRKVTPAGTISTVAGTGLSDYGGDGGPATQARLDTPVGLATDAQGNLYLADAGNHRIRKLTVSTGLITTVAGNGYGFGGDGGAALSAQLNFPTGVAIDGAGNFYISDTGNHRVRRVNVAGTISTVAGNGSAGFSGDGGPATAAQLNAPGGIGLDSAGNLFITDQSNHRVRKLTKDGRISTVAGNGTSGAGGEGGAATEAQLNAPAGVVIDRAGNLFIADTFNHRIVVVADYKAATTVSAASYASSELSAEAIAAAFGANLATVIQNATTLPLPTSLAGTTVRVRDSRGIERLAPLFFVSPQQVNYQLPAGIAAGPATMTITSADGHISTGTVNIIAASPGLFSADASGSGLAAALVFRIKADGTQSYEPIAQYDPAQQKFIALPIDLSNAADQVFLILFGTGIRGRSALSAVTAQIGGADCEVNYAGPQGGFVGLDQVNVRLPRALVGRGEVSIQLTVDGNTANAVQARIK